MSGATSQLKTTEYDFDLIKSRLIDYMKSDPTFQDYEFEGSALNLLMDVLAYNTHMNAVMANMMGNEMFIDSAQVRQNVVSLAKAIGYTPRSKRTAKAVIDLYFTGVTGSPAFITIDEGTRFTSAEGVVFSTAKQYLAYAVDDGESGEYSVEGVEIFEGYFHTFNYTVNTANTDQEFIVPSVDADISTLRVRNIAGTTVTNYTVNDNISLNDESSTVYYLDEKANGRFRVYFGDGIIGRQPLNGSTISLSYIISKYGEEANNSDVFEAYQAIDGYSSYSITTTTIAYGAAERETIASIKRLAPKMYKAQNRAVVTADYEAFLLQNYPWIDSMSIWGGEHNEPPVYGKVFIAIKPSHTEILANSIKDDIRTNLIEHYNVVTVIPEIVDPDYLYIQVSTIVSYDISATIFDSDQIYVKINDQILQYFEDNTEIFNKPFYFSKMTSYIDNADVSITNSLSSLILMKRFYPLLGAFESRSIKFFNPIKAGSVKSSYYNLLNTTGPTAKQQILDDGNGTLYTKNVLTNEIIDSDVGNVDYANGIVNFRITVYDVPLDTLDVKIYATPTNLNIESGFNQIILPDQSPGKAVNGVSAGIKITVNAENKDYK